jgi:hypothetical protein
MMQKRVCILAAACLVLSFSPFASALADEAPEEGGERCVNMRTVSRTEIIDDQTILFHMRGGVIYRNYLPHRCPGLAREERFSYSTTISRLCDNDIITVLYNHGVGLSSGPSCGLGKFYPISKDEAQALKEPPDIEPEPLPPADPEEPEASE